MQYTVAIADDEEMMLNGLTRLIPWEEMGYRVATAVESGRGLIEFLENNAVDVVLSDIRMNDMVPIFFMVTEMRLKVPP